MSRWECDKVYPTWPQQAAVIAYLGYDPFANPELGRPKGNETSSIAFLSSTGPESIGGQIRKHRLRLKKTCKEFAKELDVDAKTVRGWEAGRHQPIGYLRKRILECLKLHSV